MSAYFIVRCTYKNMDYYQDYAKHARQAIDRFNGIFLVKGTEEYFQKEVGIHQKTVVIEFKTILDAKSCYQSDEYQKAIKFIDSSSSRDFIIIEGREEIKTRSS